MKYLITVLLTVALALAAVVPVFAQELQYPDLTPSAYYARTNIRLVGLDGQRSGSLIRHVYIYLGAQDEYIIGNDTGEELMPGANIAFWLADQDWQSEAPVIALDCYGLVGNYYERKNTLTRPHLILWSYEPFHEGELHAAMFRGRIRFSRDGEIASITGRLELMLASPNVYGFGVGRFTETEMFPPP